MSSGFNRTVKTPGGYDLSGRGRSAQLNNVYIGFVKQVDDKSRMGRLKVWVPELGGQPTDPGAWIICNYASPFAGATNIYDSKQTNKWEDSQRSYGFWFVPPDLENEVLVCFINGDPGRAVWFACLFQQNMNHMVPGIPGNDSDATLPVVEYNKLGNVNIDNQQRPVFSPLADQLTMLGLDKDPIRGVSSSGARRDEPANSVFGILTPGQNQFVMDDNPEQRFIRLRTRSGAQLLLNDSDGSIYFNGGSGKNWMHMSGGGDVDVYAEGDVSVRSQGSMNFRADLDMNLEAGRNINLKARNDANLAVSTGNSTVGSTTGGEIRMYGESDVHIGSGQDILVRANNDMGLTAKSCMYMYGYSNLDVKSGGHLHVSANSDIAIKTTDNMLMAANMIHLNGPPTPDATPSPDAAEPYDNIQKDNFVESDGVFKFITRKTILYRLPHHEPYDYHGTAVSGTNNHVEQNTGPVKDLYSGDVIKQGSIVPNQTTPLDLVGTPKAGMTPGIYKGQGYDANGNPVYSIISTSPKLNTVTGYQISNTGISFIKRYEGVSKTVFSDVAGLLAIGIGHQMTSDEIKGQFVKINGAQVPLTQGLTDQQVDELLQQDLVSVQQTVRNGVTVKITQAQFDMLVSICFNINENKFKSSAILKELNLGNFDKVPVEFMRWINISGKIRQGLVNRRRAEAANFRGTLSSLS
jgi:GH24 family phage-related lysozyme (muramidase)